MEGLNHRRNTEKEETTQTQSVAPNTGEEGMVISKYTIN